MKSYTNIEQSKILAKILPLESADMRIGNYVGKSGKVDGTNVHYYTKGESFGAPEIIYAWSLAALLDILPVDWWGYNKHYFLEISKMGDMLAPYIVSYFRFREQYDGANFGRITHISFQSDNPIDACYEMILKLYELKML